MLAGEVKDLLLLDVTPLSLGIETLGGVMTTLITRNTTIPTRKSETFSTATDGQTSVEVHVLQGERQMARDNRTLGKFHLDGIPPAPRGLPQVEVTFDLDANGIVNVSAKDKATGKEQKITITASSGLSKDEVERMRKDAELHADEDKKRREEVETRNQADQAIYQAERTLTDAGDKLTADDKAPVEAAVKSLKTALEQNDQDAIKKGVEELIKAQHKVAEVLYRQSQAAPGGDATPGPTAGPSRRAAPGRRAAAAPPATATSSTPRWSKTRSSPRSDTADTAFRDGPWTSTSPSASVAVRRSATSAGRTGGSPAGTTRR